MNKDQIETLHNAEDDDAGCDDCTNYSPSQWREVRNGGF